MELASLGLNIGIFCDCLYSVLLLNVNLGLGFLGRAQSRLQVRGLLQRAAQLLAVPGVTR
jgi:hypothetical protein